MAGQINSPSELVSDRLAPNPHLPGGYVDCKADRSQLLFNMDKLRIPIEHRTMFTKANVEVRDWMYGDKHDNSHDYEHVQRVVAIAHRIIAEDSGVKTTRSGQIDPLVVYLGCMMHDVGERKYQSEEGDQDAIVRNMLLRCGASADMADTIAFIAVHVSYTREKETPEDNLKAIQQCPELAVVQDADKVDALGAIGSARCFAYGCIDQKRKKQSIHEGIRLHHERFVDYLPLMKTETGNVMALERWKTMCSYREAWHTETDVSNVF